jgi:hypothetical protein
MYAVIPDLIRQTYGGLIRNPEGLENTGFLPSQE